MPGSGGSGQDRFSGPRVIDFIAGVFQHKRWLGQRREPSPEADPQQSPMHAPSMPGHEAASSETVAAGLATLDLFDTEGQYRSLCDDGCFLVKGVLDEQEISVARQAINELTPINWDLTATGNGRGVDHYKNVFNRSPFWLPYLDKPGIIDIAERVLGKECHITGMTAWRGHPGCGGLPMHSDRVFFPVDEALLLSGAVTVPILILTVFYYLSDLTPDLCPTYVIRGSHKAGVDVLNVPTDRRDSWRGRDKEPVLCKAGDVLVMRSELWHSGSSNTTSDRVRYVLQVHYGNRFIAQRFTPYLTFQYNPEVLAQATPRQLRLLGNHVKGNYD